MALRDEIQNDPNAMAFPLAFLRTVENFTPAQWNDLMATLKKGDKEGVAKMLGMSVEQADSAFKAIKEQAQQVVKNHPDLLNMTKGR